MYFIPDESFKRFENCTVKISVNETKWTSLEARTHLTLLETLISKFDFGPVKLPGLSRNGLQMPVKMGKSRLLSISVSANQIREFGSSQSL